MPLLEAKKGHAYGLLLVFELPFETVPRALGGFWSFWHLTTSAVVVAQQQRGLCFLLVYVVLTKDGLWHRITSAEVVAWQQLAASPLRHFWIADSIAEKRGLVSAPFFPAPSRGSFTDITQTLFHGCGSAFVLLHDSTSI